jgi:hypothetical protein
MQVVVTGTGKEEYCVLFSVQACRYPVYLDYLWERFRIRQGEIPDALQMN